MTTKKSDIKLPSELILAVDAKTAAAMLSKGETYFKEHILGSDRFRRLHVEIPESPGSFSVSKLKLFADGESRYE
ncbi:hypothetical protein [Weissella kandleri]|uniref:hypothetical protein n=1 Tax=Weissella kandleri TaxID=1616 RepID=UPI00070D2BCD|nr:hypothetical protein [Weissella kandleri]